MLQKQVRLKLFLWKERAMRIFKCGTLFLWLEYSITALDMSIDNGLIIHFFRQLFTFTLDTIGSHIVYSAYQSISKGDPVHGAETEKAACT